MLKRKHFKAVIFFALSSFIILCKAVPLSVITVAEGSNSATPEIPEEQLILDEDDSTTHNLERLVSAATCLVAGVEYTHGQQIYRKDECEFCICLDGEMFCWWQDCPPVATGPCKDRRPFSPCANGSEKPTEQTTALLKSTTSRLVSSSTQRPPQTVTATELEDTWSTVDNETSSEEPATESVYTDGELSDNSVDITSQSASSTPVPTVCVVMGTEYKIGEVLPHTTGNCLECLCDSGARVTCSPHLCAPPGDDIIDYRPPGPRPDLADTF